ncbi:hypothetical protein M9Y10_021309 [Tritrichomonas musculus]|uniref:Protein kinase domain-containing protein n=1 Tax=Tritrichomonas musculus TaxID=1915356 RepID=A0ABR2HDM4_9EUKA
MDSFIFPKEDKNPTSNKQFTVGKILFKGGQAIVKEAFSKDEKDSTKYVGKRLKADFGIALTDEFKCMYNIKSNFIGQVIKMQIIGNTEYLIMKRYDSSLQDFLTQKRADVDSELYHFEILMKITTLLAGVQHLHVLKNPYLQHDLSPNNIMLDDEVSKIIDFGLLKTSISQTIMTGKVQYKPEGTYTERSELMSVAIIMLELIYHCRLRDIPNLVVETDCCSTSFDFKSEPKKLEKIVAIIREAFYNRTNIIFQIMNILTTEGKLKELIGDDYISENLLQRYFDLISDLDIIMQYNPDFTTIAEKVYGDVCHYKSFLYSMFHQKNYLYDRYDFYRYQQKIVEIYNKNVDNHPELMKNISKFHTDINFFRLNCLFGKFYKFLQTNEFNTNDDQISVNSKLFQLLLSLDFNTTRSMKYFVDSLNSIIFGANQETIKSIKAFYGVDARAKFNYLFTKSSKYDKEKFDDILHDCIYHLFIGLSSNYDSDSEVFTQVVNTLEIHDDFDENLTENFKDLTFSEFVENFNDEGSTEKVDHYKYMSYYDNGVREKFLNTLHDRFGEDFIFICILMFIHKYQELVFKTDESTFLQISEMFADYETDLNHYELDMKVIYEHYSFIKSALCEETILKCQKILPECLRKLKPEDFMEVVNTIANKKVKKYDDNDDDDNDNDDNKFTEYENLINDLNKDDQINSIIRTNQFLYDLLARNVNRYEICKKFFDLNFTENEKFPSFGGQRFDKVKLDEETSFELFRTNKVKDKFKFICTYFEPFYYNGSKYTLREQSETLTDFLKNATAEQRTKIAIHLSYDFAFLLSLPYSISFDIDEKYIVIDNDGLPKIQIVPVNDSSYFKLLGKFGNVLDLIQGESEQKNDYLASTISIIKKIIERESEHSLEKDPLFPLFPDIFFDFFNEPICYYFPGIQNYEEFINPLKEMFRYDLNIDTFRCIANQLFGFDYLFIIDNLLSNINNLSNNEFVDKINSIVTNKAKTNNFLKNKIVLREIIDFFEQVFTRDPYNIVHSLYQMYHYKDESYRIFTGDELPKDVVLIDCENMSKEAKFKLYQITFKFIAPMKYQIGDTSKLAFQVPSRKFSFEKDEVLFKDSKNLYNFIFSLIAALTYLIKMSNEDYLIPNSSNSIDIYINDNSEALLLPYSIKLEEAKQLLIKVFTLLLPKEKKAINFLKEPTTESFTDLYFELDSHIYPYQCADYIPFNYDDSIKLRNLFGLNYLSALNQHFHYKFPSTDIKGFKRIFNPFINETKYPEFTNLLNFSKKTNCLSPLCMQLLEQSLEEDGEIGITARLYLDALKSYKKITNDRIKCIKNKIYDGLSLIYTAVYIDDDGNEKEIVLKKAIESDHTRRYLHQIVRMFWIMSIIFKDEESKKYFANEYGFCGFDIIMDYYKNGNLVDNFGKYESGQEKLDLILGIAKGLFYLHKEKIIHRDMKPDNIFIDDDKKPRIGDLITMIPEEDNEELQKMELTNVFSLFYFNNDLKLTDRDVYAFGIICVEILKKKKFIFTQDSQWVNGKKTAEKNKYLNSELDKISNESNDDCTLHIINFLKDNIFIKGDMPFVSEFYLIQFRIAGDISNLPEEVKKSPIYKSFGSLISNWNKLNFEEKIVETQKTIDKITSIKKDEKIYNANKYDIIIINIFMVQKIKELLMIDDKNEQVNQFKNYLLNSYDDYFNSYKELDTKKTLDGINEKAIVKKIDDIVYSRVLLNKFVGLEGKEDIIMKMKECLLNRTVDIYKRLNDNYNSENKTSDLIERRNVSYLSEIKFIIDLLEERNDIDAGFFYQVVIPNGKPEKEVVKKDLQLRLNSIEFLYDCLEKKYPKTDEFDEDAEYEYNDFQEYITSLFDDLKDSDLNDEFTRFLIGDSFKKNSRIDRCSFIALFFCIFFDNMEKYEYLSPLFDKVIKYVVDNYINKEDANVNVKNQFYKRMNVVVRDINEFGEKRKYFYNLLKE